MDGRPGHGPPRADAGFHADARPALGDRLTSDVLFGWIEARQGDRPWGRILDAGTGAHSLRWCKSLPFRSLTGVTADPGEKARLHRGVPAAELLVGDWTDPSLLDGRQFETVIADYLLGAIDGFAPYFQDRLFERLRPVCADRLYVVGLSPTIDRGTTEADAAWYDVVTLRDAAILLVGDRCYREYPLDWTVRHLEGAGFTIHATDTFTITRSADGIRRQCDVARRKLPRMPPSLRTAMAAHIDAVEARALALAPFPSGSDWVIAASRSDGQ